MPRYYTRRSSWLRYKPKFYVVTMTLSVLLMVFFYWGATTVQQHKHRQEAAINATWKATSDKVVQLNVGSNRVVALTERGVKFYGYLDSYFVGTKVTVYCKGDGRCDSSKPYVDYIYPDVLFLLAYVSAAALFVYGVMLVNCVIRPRMNKRKDLAVRV